jgi:membrane-bound lytic murein transglycosylase B
VAAAKKKAKKKKKKKKARPRHSSPPPQPTPVPDNPVSSSGGAGAADIPSEYLRLYHAAGDANGVSWRILAAIGKNESDHGRSTLPGVASGVNSAHCCSGPMQICTKASCGNTWGAYGVDANGDGVISPYQPADAIFAAGALLKNLQAMFGNHPNLIMAAYNAGPGNVQHYHGVPPFPETQRYVARGLAYIATLAP